MLASCCGPRSTQIAGQDRNIECGEKVRGVWGKRAFCGEKWKTLGEKKCIMLTYDIIMLTYDIIMLAYDIILVCPWLVNCPADSHWRSLESYTKSFIWSRILIIWYHMSKVWYHRYNIICVDIWYDMNMILSMKSWILWWNHHRDSNPFQKPIENVVYSAKWMVHNWDWLRKRPTKYYPLKTPPFQRSSLVQSSR